MKATRVLITDALGTDYLDVMACPTRQNAHKPSPDSWILAPLLELLQLSQYLLALLFKLRIVFLGILHRKAFFDKVATFICSAHLNIDCTESDIMHQPIGVELNRFFKAGGCLLIRGWG